MTRKLSVVVPVYNSTESLLPLAQRLEAGMSHEHDWSFELIFVDDGSPNPETWPTIVAVARAHAFVRAVQLSRNFGQQAATLCGLSVATGDHVLTMDDDLQHAPEDVPAFLALADHDIVIAQFPRKQHSLFKRVTSRIKARFDEAIIGKPRHLQGSSFRLLSRTVVDGVLAFRTPNPFLAALMFYVSKDIVGVEVQHHPRTHGTTGYSFRKMVRLFSNLLINNSSLLLRWVGYLGISSSVLSAGMIAAVLYRKIILDTPILGWASLMSAVVFFGGALLFSVGVLGEYLIRIIEATEARPTWVVRRTVSAPEHNR